jgi:hypothetical protein
MAPEPVPEYEIAPRPAAQARPAIRIEAVD